MLVEIIKPRCRALRITRQSELESAETVRKLTCQRGLRQAEADIFSLATGPIGHVLCQHRSSRVHRRRFHTGGNATSNKPMKNTMVDDAAANTLGMTMNSL